MKNLIVHFGRGHCHSTVRHARLPPPKAAPPTPRSTRPGHRRSASARRSRPSAPRHRARSPLLDGESLNERSVTQLADLMRYVPGVWAESYNGNDDVFYSSRGSNLDATDYDKNGVKFLQDGLPVTTADGNNHNRALDPHERALRDHRAWRQCAGLRRQHAGRRRRLHHADRAHHRHRSALRVAAAASASGARAPRWAAYPVRWTDWSRPRPCSATAIASTATRTARMCTPMLGWQSSEDVSHALLRHLQRLLRRTAARTDAGAVRRRSAPGRADAIAGNHGKKVEAWRLAFKTTAEQIAGGTLEVGASHEAAVAVPSHRQLAVLQPADRHRPQGQRRDGALPPRRRRRTTWSSARTTATPRSRAATTRTIGGEPRRADVHHGQQGLVRWSCSRWIAGASHRAGRWCMARSSRSARPQRRMASRAATMPSIRALGVILALD